MPVVSFLNQKGGVGKTTLATNVATAIALQGRKVFFIDADPQGSALDWSAARQSNLLFPVVGLPKDTLHREIAALSAPYDWVIIDGPPRVHTVAKSAIAASDIVVIPVQPSPYDVWAAKEIVDLIAEVRVIKEGSIWVPRRSPSVSISEASKAFPDAASPHDLSTKSLPAAPAEPTSLKPILSLKENLIAAFAINRKIAGTAIGRDVAEALASYPLVPVLTATITQRVAFAESAASGQAVLETEPQGQAAQELRALAAEIMELSHEQDRKHSDEPAQQTAAAR